jgi:hypothetical protein
MILAWLWFGVVQLISLVATIIGWLLLIPFCLAQAWDNNVPDRWTWQPLNAVYGNPEDGVIGQHALIWNSTGQKVPYMPGAWAPWRAYCWSALRNSCDNLKYIFAWQNGPFYTRQFGSRTLKVGWQLENGQKVPVLSF